MNLRFECRYKKYKCHFIIKISPMKYMCSSPHPKILSSVFIEMDSN